jgi:hypothetical protein
MVIVKNIEEAKLWFINNASGTVICENERGEQKEVNCYPDAEKFFEKKHSEFESLSETTE